VVPKTNPSPFDPTKPFWVAPIPEGYQFDYFPDHSMFNGVSQKNVIMGESRANGLARMPDTPGARWLQGAITRGLMEYPGPPPAPFGTPPSTETGRDEWERRGGIVSAGEHLWQAAKRDIPRFPVTPGKNPYTQEVEPLALPGFGKKFVPGNLVNSTRVLMYAKGLIHDNVVFKTIPAQLLTVNDPNLPGFDVSFRGPFWPAAPESAMVSALVLEFPQVVGAFPTGTNYRTTINPDKVWYPLNDYPDIGTVFVDDGFLVDSATSNQHQEAAVDWAVSDPVDPANDRLDVYRNHLDNISY
jgi:hypothetical protein